MHPVLAQETIHDLSVRHIQRVEAELRRVDEMTEGAGLPAARPAGQPIGVTSRVAIATVIGLPKRRAWSHS